MASVRRLLSQSILADRRLLFSAAVVSGGFLSSKVFGLIREILIARAFGTGGDLDAFFAATSFSDLLYSVIAGGALASVFIPVFSGYLAKDGLARAAGWEFASAVINDVFLAVTLLSALGAIFAPQIVDNLLAPGFPPDRRALTADLLRLVLISTVIFGVSGTITGILHAQNHFLLPALAPSLYNLGIIAGALWLAPRYGISGLVYGIVAGSLLHLLVQLPALLRFGARYSFTLGIRQTGVHTLLGLFGPRIVTMGVVRVNSIIMTNLASRLGEGSVSSLSYAYSLWQLPESLIGTAIALAVFPRLSLRASEGKHQALRETYHSALFTILALSIPATLALVLFARPIVGMLQRGAFGSSSTEAVVAVLQFYALAIVGESLLELTSRIFYAERDSRTPMFVAVASMVTRAILMLWWAQVWGTPGLALAYAAGVGLEGGMLYLLARPRMQAAAPTLSAPILPAESAQGFKGE